MSASQQPTKVRHGVLAFTLVLATIAYLDRVRISMLAPAIQADLGLSKDQMGYVFSAFVLAYALFEVPGGWMADRFGARITLTRIVIWWSIMSACTGLAAGFLSLFIIRLLFGMGEAGAFPSLARVYSRWLPPKDRGRAFGLALMCGFLVGALFQPIIGKLLKDQIMTWRQVFFVFSSIGVVWTILWFKWFVEDPHRHPGVNKAELAYIGCAPPAKQPPVPWESLCRNTNLIVLCLICACWLYGAYFWLTWLPTYLKEARGFDIKQAGWFASLPLMATAFGMFIGGWGSDLLIKRWCMKKGRQILGIICLPIAAFAVVAGAKVSSPTQSALLLSIAAGLSAIGIIPIWAVCLEIGGKHSGVVGGTMNMFGNLGSALSPMVAGWCVQRWHSWEIPLFIVAGLYFAAAVLWFFVDSTKPIPNTA